jgi:phosphoribosylanthranilate isomerase
MRRIRIKVCGICSPNDALHAVEAGADAVGMVFYEKSPRNISVEQARNIIKAIPPFVTTVGLFVNRSQKFVEETIKQTGIDLLQFHGDEREEYCRGFDRPYIKALRIGPDTDIIELCAAYPTARGILADSYTAGIPGGTGKTFDWKLIPADISLPLILAGGLNSENVGQAISRVNPWAVDVSSGVEDSPGHKNRQKIIDFVHAVNISTM